MREAESDVVTTMLALASGAFIEVQLADWIPR